jgi:hypothetical protein
MNFRARYGETGHHPAGPLGRRLSLWSMGLRLSSPLEVSMSSLHVQAYDEVTQDQLCREDIDLVDERRWQSTIKNARYC